MAKFLAYIPNYIKQNDLVLVYFNGGIWKIIALDDMLNNLVYRDNYIEITSDNTKNVSDISITLCPQSMSPIIYFGKFEHDNKYNMSNLIIKDIDSKIKIQQLTGKSIDPLKKAHYRRKELTFMKLKNALFMYPDCLFLNDPSHKKPKKLHKLKTNKIDNRLQIDDNHLIFGIHSSISQYNKIVIDRNNKLMFDTTGSKINKYFENNLSDIRDDGGFIIPCYWHVWMTFYPKSNVITV
jgi:hypothetical protein